MPSRYFTKTMSCRPTGTLRGQELASLLENQETGSEKSLCPRSHRSLISPCEEARAQNQDSKSPCSFTEWAPVRTRWARKGQRVPPGRPVCGSGRGRARRAVPGRAVESLHVSEQGRHRVAVGTDAQVWVEVTDYRGRMDKRSTWQVTRSRFTVLSFGT